MAARSLVYGPDALKAAEALRSQRGKDEKWPYDWEFSPPGAKEDQAFGYIAVPLAGVVTPVASYQVADGLSFYPTDVVLTLQGVGFNPGDFTWSLLLNAPVGVTAAQSLPIDGYQNVPFTLGTLEIPWKVTRAERNLLHSRDTVSIQVTNVNLGAGNGYFVGVIKGYLMPSGGE